LLSQQKQEYDDYKKEKEIYIENNLSEINQLKEKVKENEQI
jgi:hypothetical protein